MNKKDRCQAHPISVDGLTLSGSLHLPPLSPSAVVIGCHGLMADKKSPKQVELAGKCITNQMAYLRFDHRGCGESEGDFDKETTLENRTSDLLAAIETVYRLYGPSIPIGLFGSSLGGSVCLTVLDKISPFAVVTLAAPVKSRSIRIPKESPLSLKEEMMKNRLAFDIRRTLTSAHHILIVHGSKDETVPVENAHTLFSLANKPKKLKILEEADHRITQSGHQKKFIEASVEWLTRCLAKRAE